MLDRWSSYTVTIVWELAWMDPALVILDEWLSYRGGCLSRFDCSMIIGIKRSEFNDNTKGNVFLKTFRGATSKDMLSYAQPTLDRE